MDQTPPRRVRWALALGLVVLAPTCAEYITGYDTSTGDPLALLGGLLIFGPLYGAPALLIREVARRFDLRWPGILALAAALGILQAGVYDQSLFSASYRDIDYWDEMVGPTWIDAVGFGASPAVGFIVGHVVWSFWIPIVLVESLRPATSRRPWLRIPGLVTTTLLYLAAGGLILRESLAHEKEHASATQVTGSLVVVALLVAVAFTVGRRRRHRSRDTAVPKPLAVGLAGLITATAFNLMPPSWPGVATQIALLTLVIASVAYLSRSKRWTDQHVVALAAGALSARAIVGFFAVPLGDVAPLAKYGHNVGFAVGAALLGAWALRQTRPTPRESPSRVGGASGRAG
jgi:hypothetical protein